MAAIVIGNGISRLSFDLNLILASERFITYGCNAIYRDFNVDHLVVTGNRIAQEVSESEYINNHKVYARKSIVDTDDRFIPIPQNPRYNSGAAATHLVAHDGHKKVFLLGFDGIDSPLDNYNIYAGTNGYPSRDTPVSENSWVDNMSKVFSAYRDAEFIRVSPTSAFRTPHQWKYHLNFRTIDFRQFAIEVDL